MHGFYRIATAVPKMKVADVAYNTAEIIRCARESEREGAALVLFPELSITGYTCGDLFQQKLLVDSALDAVYEIARAFAGSAQTVVVGLPIRHKAKLYNCAALLSGGKIVSLTPKIFLPNQREFYEKRQFSSGRDIVNRDVFTPPCAGEPVPFTNLVICGDTIRIGIEICQDLWSLLPPSQLLASAGGANLLLNLSASNALVSKAIYRRELVENQSARCVAVYAYTSSGVFESTTDTVFGGHAMICENGGMLAESRRFLRESNILFADVDIDRINMTRICDGSFQDFETDDSQWTAPKIAPLPETDTLKYRAVDPHPFIPSSAAERESTCSEVLQIQTAGLAHRIEASGAKKIVIGVSGGLDSTLALLVISECTKLLGLDPRTILAVTMPGFGTTRRTRSNSEELAGLLGCDLRKINITDACLQHFQDIGHDPEVLDVTYENVQARERTQILMDVANREHGLVAGTGDLSEIALGWSTYNADHMSMYNVNCGVPKTLVRHVVDWYADKAGGELGKVLKDILATPVSPELLPADKDGTIVQETETILGAYELHDFYLYHFIRYGAPPEKLRFLAKIAFAGKYPDAEIDRTLKIFFRRFFTQQFKRSCVPDGPKVGSIGLSPRADWRMPSDASFALWMAALDGGEQA